MIRVLIACECSGIVRDAFKAQGFDAWSCDMQPTERPGKHIVGDATAILANNWTFMLAHPPCQYLSVSGAWQHKYIQDEQRRALDLVRAFMNAPISHIAIENPVSVIASKIRKSDQVIQPWQFGHGETKATCLWLKALPLLVPTNIVFGNEAKCWKHGPGPDRSKNRARTLPGIANAMALQWGNYLRNLYPNK